MERSLRKRSAWRARGLLACTLFLLGACAAGSGSKAVGADPIEGVDGDDGASSDAGVDGATPGDGAGDGDPSGRDGGGLPPPPRDPNDEDDDDSRAGVDCDDNDPSVHPGAPEVCDGKDNDCDGFADTFAIDATTYYPDNDGDGAGNGAVPVRACQEPAGWVVDGTDCDNDDPTVTLPVSGEFCAAEDPVIYVAKHGHDDNTGASPMEAVLTIARGITRALACPDQPCSVLIAAGTYEEAVTVADGVSLFGGYSQDFMVRDEATNEVVITSQEERTVVARAIATPTKLDRLTVVGATLSGTTGRSSYGVYVRDTADALTLSRLHVVAGRGEDGARGTDGSPQSCEARGGQGGESFDCGASTGGNGDAGGDPVRGGEGQVGGNSNCPSACPLVGSDGITPGTSGRPGLAGADGNGGAPASNALGAFDDGGFVAAPAEPGQRGFHGTGGGGGGAGGTKRIRACFGCGTIFGGRGGDGGAGGCGGGGGEPGTPGGGAFALTLVNAKIVLQDARLEGGQGGQGGPGGSGIGGQPGSQVTGGGHTDFGSAKCGLIWYYSGSGGMGGVGGNGGAGGGGAGGTGGSAITLLSVGDSAVTNQGDVSVTPGTGGAGGSGGGGPGQAGSTGLTGASLPTATLMNHF